MNSKLFRALFTLVNEYGEILIHTLTNSTGHEEMVGALQKLKDVYDELGKPYPKVLASDKCCDDRSVAIQVFGEERVAKPAQVPWRARADSRQLRLGQDVHTALITDHRQAATHIEALYAAAGIMPDKMTTAGLAPPVALMLGLDTEHKAAIFSNGFYRQLGDSEASKVGLLQLAYRVPDDKFVVLLFHLARIRDSSGSMFCVPQSLKNLLADPRILKVGRAIKGDVTRLMKDYPDVVVSQVRDIGETAFTRGISKTRTPALDDLVGELFNGQLNKDPAIRCRDWNLPLENDAVAREYAALDAYYSLRCEERMTELPIASIRLSQPDAPKPVIGQVVEILDQNYKRVIAKGTITALGRPIGPVWIPSPVVLDKRTKGQHRRELDPRLKQEVPTLTQNRLLVKVTAEDVVCSAALLPLQPPIRQVNEAAGTLIPITFEAIANKTFAHDVLIPLTRLQIRNDFDLAAWLASPPEENFVENIPKQANGAGENANNGRAASAGDQQAELIDNLIYLVLDIFHGIKRVTELIPDDWEFTRDFSYQLRDALMEISAFDRANLERVLEDQGEGKTFDELFFKDPDYVLRYVRRFAPPPDVMGRRFDDFVALWDKPAFHSGVTPKVLEALQNLRVHVFRGCLSDPPNCRFYRLNRILDNGLREYSCFRGTNMVEAKHRQLVEVFGSLNAGLPYSLAVGENWVFRHNIRAAEANRPDFGSLGGSYRFDLIERAQVYHMATFGTAIYPWWPNTLSVRLKTKLPTGVVRVPGDGIVNWAKIVSYVPVIRTLAEEMGTEEPPTPVIGPTEWKQFNELIPLCWESGTKQPDFKKLLHLWHHGPTPPDGRVRFWKEERLLRQHFDKFWRKVQRGKDLRVPHVASFAAACNYFRGTGLERDVQLLVKQPVLKSELAIQILRRMVKVIRDVEPRYWGKDQIEEVDGPERRTTVEDGPDPMELDLVRIPAAGASGSGEGRGRSTPKPAGNTTNGSGNVRCAGECGAPILDTTAIGVAKCARCEALGHEECLDILDEGELCTKCARLLSPSTTVDEPMAAPHPLLGGSLQVGFPSNEPGGGTRVILPGGAKGADRRKRHCRRCKNATDDRQRAWAEHCSGKGTHVRGVLLCNWESVGRHGDPNSGPLKRRAKRACQACLNSGDPTRTQNARNCSGGRMRSSCTWFGQGDADR